MQIRKPLSVTIGPMFSGKSTSLFAKAERMFFERICPVFFKPDVDTRDDCVATHKAALSSRLENHDVTMVSDVLDMVYSVSTLSDLKLRLSEVKRFAVFIDEFQFFGPELPLVVEEIMAFDHVTSVHLFGLNLDARGDPWPTVSQILPFATEINLLDSVCAQCQKPAHRTQRRTPWPTERTTVAPGAGLDYEPRCVGCWNPEPSLKPIVGGL